MKMIRLPNVTLVCADCTPMVDRAISVVELCKRNITFGAVKVFTSIVKKYAHRVEIRPINTKHEYSSFIMYELYKHIKTSHILIVQHDGYILNPTLWDDRWLRYDYIGAPMPIPRVGKVVGNGGFSLRSKRLMEHVATVPGYTNSPNEDRIICQHRPELRKIFNFAPLTIAERFAYLNKSNGKPTFGFHGTKR